MLWAPLNENTGMVAEKKNLGRSIYIAIAAFPHTHCVGEKESLVSTIGA